MLEPALWAAFAAIAVLVWYLAEWDRMRAAGRRLSPLRHPALLFVQAVRKLFAAKQLMLPLLAFWLISGIVWWGIQRPHMMAHLMSRSGPPPQQEIDRPSHVIVPPYDTPLRTLAQSGWEQLRSFSGRLPRKALIDSIPEMRSASQTLFAFPGYAGRIVFLFVILALATMAWRRPPWLGDAKTIQPRLALALMLLMLAMTSIVTVFAGAQAVVGAIAWTIPLVTLLAAIVIYAPICHLLLQVAQNRSRLSLTLAVRATMCGLIPLIWLTAISVVVPAVIWAVRGWLSMAPNRTALVRLPDWYLPALLAVALLFVPWIILRTRASFRGAFWRNLQLWRTHWRDLITFALRYLLLVFPLQYIHAMFSGWQAAPLPSIIGNLVGGLTNLITLLMIALLYLHLERATPAGKPLARAEEPTAHSHAS